VGDLIDGQEVRGQHAGGMAHAQLAQHRHWRGAEGLGD